MQSPRASSAPPARKSTGGEQENWSFIPMLFEGIMAPTRVSTPFGVITRFFDIFSGKVSLLWGTWKLWVEAHKIPWVKATVALELKLLLWFALLLVIVVLAGLVLSCISGGITQAVSCAASLGFGGSSQVIQVLWALF